jgi:hypothetical protein
MESNTDPLLRAIASLDRHKHWTISVINETRRRRYSCTIWGLGFDGLPRRVTGQGLSPLLAIQKAEASLINKGRPKLKLVK